MMTAQQLDLVTRYQQLRRTGNELGLHIARQIPKAIFDQGARRLGLLRKDFLVLDTKEDEGILIDFCLYDVRTEGKNFIEQVAPALNPAPGSDQALFLEAMRQAHYSIFEVTGLEPGVGVQVSDRLYGGNRLIVDAGLAGTASVGNSFAARLLACDDVTLTSGAILPLNARWLEVLDVVITQLAGEFQVRNLSHLDEAQRSELSATIIYSALSFGASRGARFMPQPADGEHIMLGRQDACPCGSGQPFGACCGRRG
ncbi:MAG: SEC-C metal-binding domain-containing protein [Gemmataceae bacterium]